MKRKLNYYFFEVVSVHKTTGADSIRKVTIFAMNRAEASAKLQTKFPKSLIVFVA